METEMKHSPFIGDEVSYWPYGNADKNVQKITRPVCLLLFKGEK